VGGIRAALSASICPATAPIKMAAPKPPAHAKGGTTTCQPLTEA